MYRTTHILILIISEMRKISAVPSSDLCATLYTSEGFEGKHVNIITGSRFTDLTEEYFTNSRTTWNTTGSFRVEDGCQFTGCTDRYFKGCKDYHQAIIEHLTVPFLSAKCTCQKDCSCSNIQMKKSSCAYAFADPGGCNSCNPRYFEMLGSRPYFPTTVGNLSGILIQDGCTLTIYEGEEYEGVSTGIQGYSIVQNVTGPIGSHECVCKARSSNSDSWSSPQSSNVSDFTFISVPNSINEVMSAITSNNEKQPGLISALASVKNRRSSHNAYILILGSTGSGKSSAINILFDHRNITAEGDSDSTTSEIHEFRVPIPLDELQIGNSELRVIDTPGLGDTRGLEYDARFLATLDRYLNTHEDLHTNIPNVVLIFHKFTDNRFSGNHSNFVKMLRGLQTFRNQITDETYSNVIFVLTHFNSANAKVKKNPRGMIQAFKTVIEDFSLFPKPISIVIAENVGHGNDLLSINGGFELQTGDLYPGNLIQKMIQITSQGQDPIGRAIFKKAFVHPGVMFYENYKITPNTFKVIENPNSFDSKYSKYFYELSASLLDLESTEVSRHLAEAYENMEHSLKLTFPSSLIYLQKALLIRNILSLLDVPKTNLEITELFSRLQFNEAIVYLLKAGLSLSVPKFGDNIFIGQSYNALSDVVSSTQLIKECDPVPTNIGYQLPSSVTTFPNRAIEVKDFLKVFQDKEEYLKWRSIELGLPVELSSERFVGEIKPGYNLVPSLSAPNRSDTVTLTAIREFRTFTLILNEEYDLSPNFIQALKNLRNFDVNNYGSIESWTNFFQIYGTHMVHSVYGGGSIEITATVKISDVDTVTQSIFDLINVADVSDKHGLDISKLISHNLKFKGGDPNYQAPNLEKMSVSDAFNLITNWKKSLDLRPVILTSQMKVVPLSQLADKAGQNISSEIAQVTSRLFNSTLTSEWFLSAVKKCENEKNEAIKSSLNSTITVTDATESKLALLRNLTIKIAHDNRKFKLDLEAVNVKIADLKMKVVEKSAMISKRSRCKSYSP